MFFGVEDDLIGEVTTHEIDDVPEPRARMPAGGTSPVADVGVVEGNEGVEEEFSSGKSCQEPGNRHEGMSGKCDENSE